MAITRSQYITVDELQEILNDDGTLYPNNCDGTTNKIYEASELIKAHCWDWSEISADDYTTATAPNDLKLATAYQVEYNDSNLGIDNEYAGATKSISIGKTSETTSYGEGSSKEYQKIAPKTQRYLIQSGLVTRIL
jgi:hypothetical protein